MPEAHGGAGLSLTEFAHVSEELGRSPLGHYVFNCQAPDVGNMEMLIEHGTPAQQARFLLPLVARRDPQLLHDDRARVRRLQPGVARHHGPRDGDAWVITGHKWFASSADGAAFADLHGRHHPRGRDRTGGPA